ncbi:hypothetical protein [Candidatus Minimicrobia vallesae]|uniref:hypothetical protein n=1 Tax=Candidatus Minimicrobia vallesae TaxID=2841264 RepID=UPI002FCD6D2B
MLTGTPFDGPVAGLRVGRVNGEFKAFLTPEEREKSDLDLVVAGIESGITMVEAGAKEVSEDVIVDAMTWAHSDDAASDCLATRIGGKSCASTAGI